MNLNTVNVMDGGSIYNSVTKFKRNKVADYNTSDFLWRVHERIAILIVNYYFR